MACSVHDLGTSKVMEFDVFCLNFKGDWKYIWQLFSLNRYTTKEEAGVLDKWRCSLPLHVNRFVMVHAVKNWECQTMVYAVCQNISLKKWCLSNFERERYI